MNWAAALFATALDAVAKRPAGSGGSIAAVTKSILRYPVKTVAAFVMAPVLALRVACIARDPVRRVIAGAGLALGALAAWAVSAFVTLGFFGLWNLPGFWPAPGYLFGISVGVPLGVVLAVLALNATAWLFLHMSSEEVVQYLRSLSE